MDVQRLPTGVQKQFVDYSYSLGSGALPTVVIEARTPITLATLMRKMVELNGATCFNDNVHLIIVIYSYRPPVC